MNKTREIERLIRKHVEKDQGGERVLQFEAGGVGEFLPIESIGNKVQNERFTFIQKVSAWTKKDQVFHVNSKGYDSGVEFLLF
jgi:hypothetical protein